MMLCHLLVRRFALNAHINTSIRCFSSLTNYAPRHLVTRPTSQNLTQLRTFWESFPFGRPLLHEKDNLDRKEYEIVYHSKMFTYGFYGQLIAYTMFATQIYAGSSYAYQVYMTGEIIKPTTTVGAFLVTYNAVTVLAILYFTLQNFMLFLAAQNLLLRVYFNEKRNEYVFVSLGKNPLKSKLTFCKPGELKCLKHDLLSIFFGTHKLKGKRFYIRYDNFKSNFYYNELLGHKYN